MPPCDATMIAGFGAIGVPGAAWATIQHGHYSADARIGNMPGNLLLSVLFFKLLHQLDQRLDAFDRHCVVNAGSHAANASMTF